MSETMRLLAEDRRVQRRKHLTHRVLRGLRETVQLRGKTPETPVEDVWVDFTDQSAAYLAPLIEAVEILEDIIYASDGCRGHRGCTHSMEPWQRARALLQGKWEADCGERRTWPDGPPAVTE